MAKLTPGGAKLAAICAGLNSRLAGTLFQWHIGGAVLTLLPDKPVLLAEVLAVSIGERALEKLPNDRFPSRDDKALALRIIDTVMSDDGALDYFFSLNPAIQEALAWIKDGLSPKERQVFKDLELGKWNEFIDQRMSSLENLQALLSRKNCDADQRERVETFVKKRIAGKTFERLLFDDFDLLEVLEKAKPLPGRPRKCLGSMDDYDFLDEIKIRVLCNKQTMRQACIAVTNNRKTRGTPDSEVKRLERAYKAKMNLREYGI